MYDTILVPTDGSENARRAADRAIDLAASFDATIHALSVVDATRLGPFTPTDVDVSELKASLRREAMDATATVASRAASAGVECVEVVRVGVPHETILTYADEEAVDLVVMGTHGRTGLARALLGSVTERVVRASSVPVLTVGPD